jgi:hypothetical protein
MGTKELRGRENWQEQGGTKAGAAEKGFLAVFHKEFEGSDFRIREKPRDFAHIYESIQLPEKVLAEIYNPPGKWIHGVSPDYAIDNRKTNKTLYVEVKRQDGWVEGKLPSAGRGNAHERSCKFFTPGLLKILRAHGNLGAAVLPFWVVFQGDISRDPKRVREVHCWFAEHSDHFFMWSTGKPKALTDHFNTKLKRLFL